MREEEEDVGREENEGVREEEDCLRAGRKKKGLNHSSFRWFVLRSTPHRRRSRRGISAGRTPFGEVCGWLEALSLGIVVVNWLDRRG